MTTRQQLEQDVDAWLIRDDVAVTGSDWPSILRIAEANIAREIVSARQEKKATVTFTGHSADLPSDFIEPRNPFVDDNTRRIEYKTPQALRESREWQNGRVAMSYTLEGNNTGDLDGTETFQMTIAGPASATDPTDIEINYWARLPALTDPSDTNWLLTNHYDVYLYAALWAAAIYLQDDALAATYYALFDGAKNSLGRQENRKRFGAMPKQMYGFPRTVV